MIRDFKKLKFLMTDKTVNRIWKYFKQMPRILKQTEIAVQFLMAAHSVDDCTLKTSYRDFDEIYFIKTSEKTKNESSKPKIIGKAFLTQKTQFLTL